MEHKWKIGDEFRILQEKTTPRFMNTDGDIICTYPTNMTAILQVEEINDTFE